MFDIFGDDTARIEKRALGRFEPNTVLCYIRPILRFIPFKAGAFSIHILHHKRQKKQYLYMGAYMAFYNVPVR